MDNSHFFLLIPAGMGVFFTIYFTLTFLSKLVVSRLEKQAPKNAYDKAYEKDNAKEVYKADFKLAYQKLKELATTKKSYRSRKTDLKFVIEMGIPPNTKLRNLLSNALPNQNDPETIELITNYLQKVNQASKTRTTNGLSITIPHWQILTDSQMKYYVPATSLFILIIISLIYLTSWVERLNKKQFISVCVYIFLALAIVMFLWGRQYKMLPSYFGISGLVLCALLYTYSNTYHKNALIPYSDPGFKGKADCPRWFRADEDCSMPIFITSESDDVERMRVIYDDSAFLLRKDDGACKEIAGPDFSVSRSTPYSFRLQAKNGDLFKENGSSTVVGFDIISSAGAITPLNALKCEIRLENDIWAEARKILLDLLEISGGLTLLPFAVSFVRNLMKTL